MGWSARYRRNAGEVVHRVWRRTPPDSGPPPRMALRLGAFAVLVLAIVIVAIALDRISVGWARGLSDGARQGFAILTEFGRSQWYLVPTGLIVVVLQFGDWRRVPAMARAAWAEVGALAGYVFAAVVLSGVLVNIVKVAVGRARPPFYDRPGWPIFDPLTFGYANASFPSGHATTMGAIMVAGALIFPRFRLAFVLFALAICVSRVAVSAHFPSDVVAGLGVGAGTAYLLARWGAERGYAFRRRPAEGLTPRVDALRRAWQRPGGRADLRKVLRRALAR